MPKCFGLTRNLNRCGRTGNWRFFCREHKKQPLVWAGFFTFTALGGTASIISYLSPPAPAPPPVNQPTTQTHVSQQENQSKVNASISGYMMDSLHQQPAFMVSLIVNNDGGLPVFITSMKIDAGEQGNWIEADGIRPINQASGRNQVFDPPFGFCIEPGGQRVFGVYYWAKKKVPDGKEEVGLDYFVGFTTINVGFVDSTAARANINAVKILQ